MMTDDLIDRLLRALADPTRRLLLDRLRDQPGLTQGELTAGVALTRQALSKHLATLEAAELVVPVWRGREKLHYLNPQPLQALPERWIGRREHGAAMAALQRALAPAAPPPAGAADPLVALLLAPAAPGLPAARRFLAATADAVRQLIALLPAAGGTVRPAAGGFSIAEQLWHLADIEELGWAPRFERLRSEARPRLPGVDGDRLAIERAYRGRPWRGAARRFIAQRRRTLRALGHFDDALLARPCHFAGQPTTAADVLAAMVAHDAEHREQIAALWPLEDKESPR